MVAFTHGNSSPAPARSCPSIAPSASPRYPANAPAAGAAALAYLTELTYRRPRTWIHEVERLHELLQAHGDAALRTAFERGLAEQAIGAEYIAHYLGTPLPSLPFDDTAGLRR